MLLIFHSLRKTKSGTCGRYILHSLDLEFFTQDIVPLFWLPKFIRLLALVCLAFSNARDLKKTRLQKRSGGLADQEDGRLSFFFFFIHLFFRKERR